MKQQSLKASQVGTPSRSHCPLVRVSLGPKIQPQGAAVPARPTGQTVHSAASYQRKSETPIPQ
eukprot:3171294-Alexandrium_andersonii.AAC.1